MNSTREGTTLKVQANQYLNDEKVFRVENKNSNTNNHYLEGRRENKIEKCFTSGEKNNEKAVNVLSLNLELPQSYGKQKKNKN